MLISTAYAQGAGFFDNQSALIQFLPLILIFAVFYFLLIRPQQRKAKDHRTMLDALRRGDRVVTGGVSIATEALDTNPQEGKGAIAAGVRVRVFRRTDPSSLPLSAPPATPPRGLPQQ